MNPPRGIYPKLEAMRQMHESCHVFVDWKEPEEHGPSLSFPRIQVHRVMFGKQETARTGKRMKPLVELGAIQRFGIHVIFELSFCAACGIASDVPLCGENFKKCVGSESNSAGGPNVKAEL
jgi:hypothetical protein